MIKSCSISIANTGNSSVQSSLFADVKPVKIHNNEILNLIWSKMVYNNNNKDIIINKDKFIITLISGEKYGIKYIYDSCDRYGDGEILLLQCKLHGAFNGQLVEINKRSVIITYRK